MAVQVSYDAAFTACASRRFAEALSAPGSYASLKAVTEAARRIWWNDVTVQDWLESFEANAVLGDAGDSLQDCCAARLLHVQVYSAHRQQHLCIDTHTMHPTVLPHNLHAPPYTRRS